ncbi:unnamed protein product [Lupinus luteus]|uniref:HMA domain-containing protein n=1 Tax=Lupinus luteus TaxID=3873 RepID=A0AAV1WY97_LUPLU
MAEWDDIGDAQGGGELKTRCVVGWMRAVAAMELWIVILRVSMHCRGCAKKVEKHISKLEGVNSYKVDLANKMVVVIGDILPSEVLECVSKVKRAEIWNSPPPLSSADSTKLFHNLP